MDEIFQWGILNIHHSCTAIYKNKNLDIKMGPRLDVYFIPYAYKEPSLLQ